MQTPKQTFGSWGEDVAEAFLRRKGYAVTNRNFRVKTGEIDIIAWKRTSFFSKTLCFIEVKSRRGEPRHGGAERATGHEKQRRMMNAAMHWCLENAIPTDRTPIQFEHVSVYDTGREPEIFHYVLPAS